MCNSEPLAAEILVTAEVSVEEEQGIVETLHTLGVAARTRMVATRRGLDQLHWLVLAVLPLQAFLTGLGSVAAQRQRGRWRSELDEWQRGQAKDSG